MWKWFDPCGKPTFEFFFEERWSTAFHRRKHLWVEAHYFWWWFPFPVRNIGFSLERAEDDVRASLLERASSIRRARRRASRCLGFSVKILLPVASTAVTVNKTACLNYTDTSVVWFSVAMTKYRPLGRKSFTEKSYTGFSGPFFWAIRDAQSRSSSFKKRVLSLFCGWLTRRWFFSMGFEIERAE